MCCETTTLPACPPAGGTPHMQAKFISRGAIEALRIVPEGSATHSRQATVTCIPMCAMPGICRVLRVTLLDSIVCVMIVQHSSMLRGALDRAQARCHAAALSRYINVSQLVIVLH